MKIIYNKQFISVLVNRVLSLLIIEKQNIHQSVCLFTVVSYIVFA